MVPRTRGLARRPGRRRRRVGPARGRAPACRRASPALVRHGHLRARPRRRRSRPSSRRRASPIIAARRRGRDRTCGVGQTTSASWSTAGGLRGASDETGSAARTPADYAPIAFPAAMLVVFFVVPSRHDRRQRSSSAYQGGFYKPDFVLRQLRAVPVAVLRQRARLLADARGAGRDVVRGDRPAVHHLLTRMTRQVQIVWLVACLRCCRSPR